MTLYVKEHMIAVILYYGFLNKKNKCTLMNIIRECFVFSKILRLFLNIEVTLWVYIVKQNCLPEN